MRLIDADELMMHGFQPPEFSVCPVDICHDNVAVDAYKRGWNDAIEAIVQNEPTVEPKRGKWIPVTNGRGGHECDQCHDYAPSWQTGEEHLTNYCPNCGARMDEEVNDESDNT